MKFGSRIIFGALTVLLSCRTASAVTTYTPPVLSSQGDVLSCVAENLSAQPVQVVSELNNGLGTIVDTDTFTVTNVDINADTDVDADGTADRGADDGEYRRLQRRWSGHGQRTDSGGQHCLGYRVSIRL